MELPEETVIEIAEQKIVPIEEKNLTVEDLKTADEVFFTGTATGVIGGVSIDKGIYPRTGWKNHL